MRKKFDYNSVPGDYQYNAAKKGRKLQKFWHLYKIRVVETLLKVRKTDVILDVGCGSGNILVESSKKAKIAYGADISSKALKFVIKRAKKEGIKNLKLIKIKGNKFPFKNSFFDKIIATELIEHLENPSALLKECYRVLKPGGLIFITTPNYKSFWPVLEGITDLLHLTPKMRDEQHITKLNSRKMQHILQENRFKILKLGSFYFLSPFISVFSEKISRKIFALELKQRIFPGMLLYCIAKK